MVLLTATVWVYHCTPTTTITDLGGSEVVGKLVTEDSAAVSGAEVRALLITREESDGKKLFDTTIVATVTSDNTGQFVFADLGEGEYILKVNAAYRDDSLVLVPIPFHPDSTRQVNLGILVMKVPGAIGGTVVRDSIGPDEVIDCYIAGTSYGAKINSSTPGFTISNIIPDTTYEVTISSHGYTTVTIPVVSVKPGETTMLSDTVRLELDPDDAPAVAPTGLSVTYDTLTGTARLTWQPVPLADVERYHVYSTSTCGLLGEPVTVNETTATISIFSGGDDSVKTVCFQVAAYDNDNMEGPLGKVETLVAVPPSWLRVEISLTRDESRGTGDSVYVAMNFSSRIRLIDTIVWRADDSILKTTCGVGATSGTDTILWVISADTNTKQLYVTLTDNADTTWTDSIDAGSLLPIKCWETIDSLNNVRRYAGAGEVGGKIYVFGGCSDRLSTTGETTPKPVAAVEMYDAATKEWKTLNSTMKVPRFQAASAAVNGKIYVFGGTNNYVDVTLVEEYDPGADLWQIIDSMPQTMVGASACVINGVIYLTGGMSGTRGNPVMVKTITTYDPSNRTWSTAGELQTPRLRHQAVVSDGRIMILGGLGFSLAYGEFPLDNIELKDASGTPLNFSTAIPSTRFSFGAAVIGKKLLLFGGLGDNLADELPMKSVGVYENDAGWVPGPDMPAAREGAATVALDGRVYVIGGGVGGTASQKSTRTVYVYYP
ncbi:MAG: hypothetical protein JW913_18535 [Chitinispirillaceae bacterium]|nr:hypothetical protein [Chitinispirillaceae bacterium]